MSKPRILWITDPWATLDHPKDTTLRLIEESISLGIETHWCDVKSIRFQQGAVWLASSEVHGVYPGRTAKSFKLAPSSYTKPETFTQIHYRVDPPVDLAYLLPLQMLALGVREAKHTEVVNPLSILLGGNEKIEAGTLGDLMPATLASSDWEALLLFGQSEGRTVLKPLYEAQSKGVELLDWRDPAEHSELKQRLEVATEGFTRPVLLQHYLEGIVEGEQRLWFLNGRLLAAVRKKPKSGEFKIDMDQGGTLALTELTAEEKKASQKIGRHLRALKIRLAAVDLIEGLVTDFNFTSPGLLTPMEALLGENLARPVIESLIEKF